MAESMKDLLGGHARSEPKEFAKIKAFVKERFDVIPRLSASGNNIVISLPNSAVAGSLKFELHTLQASLRTTKNLIIRIS